MNRTTRTSVRLIASKALVLGLLVLAFFGLPQLTLAAEVTCASLGGTCEEKNQCTPVGIAAGSTATDCLAQYKICCVKAGAAATPSAPATPPAAGGAGSPTTLTDPLHGIGLLGIVNRLIMTFLGVVGAFALLVFVYAGVVYMTAGGKEESVTKARDTMKYALIGLALIIFAYALANFYLSALTG
jgi:hypothetical protein